MGESNCVRDPYRKLRKVKMESPQDEHLRGTRDSGLVGKRVVKSRVGVSKVYKWRDLSQFER